MRRAYDVEAVRFAESETMRVVPERELMLRAARGLENHCVTVLLESRGAVSGARIVLLVGSGNNGGDTLFAGAALADRGASVTAVALSADPHADGTVALLNSGGRLRHVTSEAGEAEVAAATRLIRQADLVLDGIVGIGGSGALREPAATLVRGIDESVTIRVAVDVPSGVDSDSGAVSDPDAVFTADLTVTFGCLKSGLVLPPGRDRAGVVELVDIGLEPQLASLPDVKLLQLPDVRPFFRPPSEFDYKYSHGVVGVVAGSSRFRGAATMVCGAARHTGVGMVRIADRGDGVAAEVVNRFPDVVSADGKNLGDDPRATAWIIGPGADTGQQTASDLATLLRTDLPVVVDADAITVVAHDQSLRDLIHNRSATTVLTPHVGEFARLGYEVGDDRLRAASAAADDMQAVFVLKGPGTVIAGPNDKVYVDPIGPPALATAGSGDALSGLVAGALAGNRDLPYDEVRVVAAAVFLHGLAARVATRDDQPMTAWDLVQAVPMAVAEVRRL